MQGLQAGQLEKGRNEAAAAITFPVVDTFRSPVLEDLPERVDSGRGQDRTLIGRQGEIRDRSSEDQHYRMARLNLLAVNFQGH